jgi:hypothetical protein
MKENYCQFPSRGEQPATISYFFMNRIEVLDLSEEEREENTSCGA